MIQPFPAGMVAPPQPAPKRPADDGRAALIAAIAKMRPLSRRRLELEQQLRELTMRQLRLECALRARSRKP